MMRVPLGVYVRLHEGNRVVPNERPFRHRRRHVEFRGVIESVKVVQMTRRDLAEGIDCIRKRAYETYHRLSIWMLKLAMSSCTLA